jgi:hypothetical protein
VFVGSDGVWGGREGKGRDEMSVLVTSHLRLSLASLRLERYTPHVLTTSIPEILVGRGIDVWASRREKDETCTCRL